MDLICTVPRPLLLGRALIWPDHFSASSFGHWFLNSLLPFSQRLLDSFRQLGKVHWFPYLGQSFFHKPNVFRKTLQVGELASKLYHFLVFGRIRGKVRVLPLKQRLVHVQLYFTHVSQPLTINNTIAPITHHWPIQTSLAPNSTTPKYMLHNALF